MPKPRARAAAIKAVLDSLAGEEGDRYVKILDSIAEGTLAIEVREQAEGSPLIKVTTVTPTISERLRALELILAYQHGRPSQSLEIEDKRPPKRWNPDHLTLPELEQMRALAKKAEVKQTEDAELVDEEENQS